MLIKKFSKFKKTTILKELESTHKFDINKIKLIVALGNPGKEYVKTRHNVGFIFFDHFNIEFLTESKFKAEIAQFKAENQKIIFAKPNTYMNSSGESVIAINNFYKLIPSEILVVHDDLDIQLGEYKLQFSKGPKVHNGILSIENLLSTEEFWRLRIGIDNRTQELKKHISGSDYVLGRFTDEELTTLEKLFTQIKTEYFSL